LERALFWVGVGEWSEAARMRLIVVRMYATWPMRDKSRAG
jgi:hypothetical protein